MSKPVCGANDRLLVKQQKCLAGRAFLTEAEDDPAGNFSRGSPGPDQIDTQTVPSSVTVSPSRSALRRCSAHRHGLSRAAPRVYRIVPGQAPGTAVTGLPVSETRPFAPSGSLLIVEFNTGYGAGPADDRRCVADCDVEGEHLGGGRQLTWDSRWGHASTRDRAQRVAPGAALLPLPRGSRARTSWERHTVDRHRHGDVEVAVDHRAGPVAEVPVLGQASCHTIGRTPDGAAGAWVHDAAASG